MDTIPANDPMENPPQPPLAGLDPADLLKQGAAEDTFLEGAAFSFVPPSVDELAALFPQFEILELIGKGGMGAVYKVRQKELDRIVALKILPPAIGETPGFAARFAREAKALAKLNHPGIVTIHEFGQQDGLYFILMEFVDGVNLAQLMRSGRISPREALAIVPQICDALQFAHDRGIVHRDIKPENILLDRLGRVKVADFGIAKVVAACDDPMRSGGTPVPTDATIAGKIIGTPHYMAPEQIDHPADVDHRADIYALGVVFYQMLTGELPDKELQAPSRKVHIDVRLDEIVMQAMERNPELRYQQASVFKTRVETVVQTPGQQGVAASELIRSDQARLTFEESPGQPVRYPAMGEVALHADRLVVSLGAMRRGIPLSNVVGLGEAVIPAWYSPAGHRFCAVDFEEDGTRRRVAFMPGASLFRSVQSTRHQASRWNSSIQRWAKSATGRHVVISASPARLSMDSIWAFLWLPPVLIAVPFLWKALVPESSGFSGTQILIRCVPFLMVVLALAGTLVWRGKSLRPNVASSVSPELSAHERAWDADGEAASGSAGVPVISSRFQSWVGLLLVLCLPGALVIPYYQDTWVEPWHAEEFIFTIPSQVDESQTAATLAGLLAPYPGVELKVDPSNKKWKVSATDRDRKSAQQKLDQACAAIQRKYDEGKTRKLTETIVWGSGNSTSSNVISIPSRPTFIANLKRNLWIGGPLSAAGMLCLLVRRQRGRFQSGSPGKLVVVLAMLGCAACLFIDGPLRSIPGFALFGIILMVGSVLAVAAGGRFMRFESWMVAVTWLSAVAFIGLGISSRVSQRMDPGWAVVSLPSVRTAERPAPPEPLPVSAKDPMDGQYQDAVMEWLGIIDSGMYENAWNEAALFARSLETPSQWATKMSAIRNPLGKMLSRVISRRQWTSKLLGAPEGQYLIYTFRTKFESGSPMLEVVTLMFEKDGNWRAMGYSMDKDPEPPAKEGEFSSKMVAGAAEAEVAHALVVRVAADGAVTLGGAPVSLPTLEDVLKKASQAYKDTSVSIQSAPDVPYAKVVEMMDLCQKSGIWNLSFATPGKPDLDSVSLWLTKMDEGDYTACYAALAEVARKTASEKQYTDAMTLFRKPMGAMISRGMTKSEEVRSLPGMPDGEHRVMQFSTEFANKKAAVETLIITREKDGRWRTAGYFIK